MRPSQPTKIPDHDQPNPLLPLRPARPARQPVHRRHPRRAPRALLSGLPGRSRSDCGRRPGELLPAPQRSLGQPRVATGATGRRTGAVRPRRRAKTLRPPPGRTGRNHSADGRHQLRRLWLADRKTPAQPARRGRGAVEPVQPSLAGALGRRATAVEPGAQRIAPYRLCRPPVSSRPRRRATGQRKPPGLAPTRRGRVAVVSGDDGDHGHLARIQYRPEPRAACDPALGGDVSDNPHRVLQLCAVLQGRHA
ncbi:hypothetical protein PS687_04811 [Pseudomonas fluorescens]|nr:hypothetical protein PS687_04811 [Pseudomonas fluorescens]